MTTQIQFFCNSHEEQAVLARLAADKTVIVFLLDGHRMIELPAFSIDQLPDWPEFFCLYFWAKEYGPLQWHANRPKVKGASHRTFVKQFLRGRTGIN